MADESDKSSLAKRIQLRNIEKGMNKAQTVSKQQQKDYATILVEYLRDNGQIICISDDITFVDALRGIVTDTLRMPAACIKTSSRADTLGSQVRQEVTLKKKPLLIVEQNINGRDLTFAVKIIKNTFPELKILMLIRETNKNRFVLLHESGVDSFIVKPVTSQAILEKIALTIKPNEQIERALNMAKSLMQKEEYLLALQTCNQALEQQSNSAVILLLMGDIFKMMKEYEKAAEAYNKASSTSSLFLEPLRKLTELYNETGDIVKQIEYLEKMDEASPLNLERKIQIGELLLKLNKNDKAKKIFDQAMKLSNRQARESISGVAYRVADLYMNNDPDMAASFLKRGLEARKEFWSHEDIATFNRLGLLLRRSGKWNEAVEEYNKALHVAPNDENLHYNLAMAYLEGKQIESARASALKAMAINPDLSKKSSRIASNLAAVFMSSNDRMHALPLLRQALELDPANNEAKELLSQANADDSSFDDEQKKDKNCQN